MQKAGSIGTNESEADMADGRRPSRGMIPLTQSKMHAMPTPAPEPGPPRRSPLVIEILSFALIAFLVVSALLFNLTAPRPLVSGAPAVSVPLPPKLEPAQASAPAPVAEAGHPAPEPGSAGAASLPEVEPQAGATAAAAPRPDTTIIETLGPTEEIAALPPAADPVAPPAAEPVAPEAATEAPVAATPAPVEETASLALPAEETAALIRRGDELLGIGDIVAARAAYERAATGGDRAAALGVAKTYDPIFLVQTGVRGLRGDPARAALWYARAAAAGDRDAQQRLRRLRAQYPQ
jgi:hypothetical protein